MLWLLFASTLTVLAGLSLVLWTLLRTSRHLQAMGVVAVEVTANARSAADPRAPAGR